MVWVTVVKLTAEEHPLKLSYQHVLETQHVYWQLELVLTGDIAKGHAASG